jgi:hypothetical protein
MGDLKGAKKTCIEHHRPWSIDPVDLAEVEAMTGDANKVGEMMRVSCYPTLRLRGLCGGGLWLCVF